MLRRSRGGALLLAAALLSACAGAPRSGEERAEQVRERLDLPQGEAPEAAELDPTPPDSVASALRAPSALAPSALRAEQPRFDLTVDNVPAREFFHGVVEDTPYNVVVDPEVEGTVSLTLRDVAVPEIMATVEQVYGYQIRRTETAYTVTPARLDSRLFELDYLNVQRTGSSSTRISSGDISGEGGGDGNGGGSGSEVETSSKSALWSDIEETVERMLSGHEGASVVASPEAGTLAVRALPATLRKVEAYVGRLQRSLNRQVILEARIVEVELSDGFRAGIDWSALGSDAGRVLSGSVSATGEAAVGTEGTFELNVFRGSGEGQDGPASFTGVLSILERRGDLQVLSSPRVSTLNNQKAVIKAGTDSFYQTDINIDRRTVNDQLLTELEPEFEPFFSGVALDVTPQVGEDGWITLHIQPSVTQVEDVARSLQLSGEDTISFRLAESDVRQADALVRARDGEMIVIGGLIDEREETATSRVPLLGRIPLLGWLFTQQRQQTQEYELVILLRPRVVEQGTWAERLEERSEHLQQRYTE
nr:pilus (MSHA type) biogenesis protein MshL [Halorhodospira neutriphila]